MNCDFIYCIYNKSFHCVLEKITVNALGMCENCIILTIPHEDLETMKDAERTRLEDCSNTGV